MLNYHNPKRDFFSALPLREGPPLFPSPFFSWRRLAALGNMKANFHCAHLHNLSPQGTRDVPTALSIVFTTPSVPLVGDRNGAQTASLYGWRTIRGLRQQRSCGFLCGDEPQGHTMQDACSMLMEPHGYDEECSMLIARNLLRLLLMGTKDTNRGLLLGDAGR